MHAHQLSLWLVFSNRRSVGGLILGIEILFRQRMYRLHVLSLTLLNYILFIVLSFKSLLQLDHYQKGTSSLTPIIGHPACPVPHKTTPSTFSLYAADLFELDCVSSLPARFYSPWRTALATQCSMKLVRVEISGQVYGFWEQVFFFEMTTYTVKLHQRLVRPFYFTVVQGNHFQSRLRQCQSFVYVASNFEGKRKLLV